MLLSRPKLIRGGVRTDSRKHPTADCPLVPIRPPARLFVSLAQHIGAPALALVEPGDKVLQGQLIGQPDAGISAAVHSPCSGTVIDITEHPAPHPSGLPVKTVVIEPDGNREWDPNLPPPLTAAAEQIDSELIAERVAAAGIVGMGGAAFPAAVKLTPDSSVQTLIINGGECEPYLTGDDRLMRERAAGIIDGARLMAHALGAQRTAIGIEDNKPEAIHAMQRAAESLGYAEVMPVPSLWPQGSEKHLIYTLTGREVPAGKLAADIGVVVHNVGTAYAVHRAIRQGEPLIRRPVTVGGGAVKEPGNFEAPIGTPLAHLIELAGGLKCEPARILAGGPMMGQEVPTSAALAKGTTGVIALTAAEIREPDGLPCIRCGRCVDSCPMGLMPFEIANRAASEDLDGAIDNGLLDCLTCGSCAYVCPSARPLVQLFHYARGRHADNAASRQRAELQKRLAENRAERQRREAEAKKKAAAERRKRRAAQKQQEQEQQKPKEKEEEVEQQTAKHRAAPAQQQPETQPREQLEQETES
ncbi:electron transport complex subunit RsxC [Halorhodospira halochloris]|uniref:electron transport complex subunit RsxC n=1 Tax=Halorhodospira halochloris TaxID=1052 RepID=UPI001EE927E2|nr:electron transport complex subunit RsxC [Halorhodospira halochloris]MCG5530515.1 electron transport complex subunit RsxC [Halorhodospira halochloris]